MTADQLDDYMTLLLKKQWELGPHYVRRQLEWAESQLEKLGAVKAAGAAPAALRSGAPEPSPGGDLAVCASSGLSSGCVVAPQIGLNRETHANKSHG